VFGSAKYHTLISPPTRWDFGLEGNKGLATAGALTFLTGALVLVFGACCNRIGEIRNVHHQEDDEKNTGV
jgi:hypothetical protein